MRLLAIALFLFLYPSSISAQIDQNSSPTVFSTAGEMVSFIEGIGEERISAAMMLSTAESTYRYVDLMRERDGLPRRYCPPRVLELDGSKISAIFKSTVEKHPEFDPQAWQLVLLSAMQLAFPCDTLERLNWQPRKTSRL